MEYEDAAKVADEKLGAHEAFMRLYQEAEIPAVLHEDLWKMFQLAFFIGASHGIAVVDEGLDKIRERYDAE